MEFRHESRITDEVFDLLDRHGAGFVISAIAEREPILRATGRLVYLRWHNSDPTCGMAGVSSTGR